MKIELKASTGNLKSIDNMLYFSQLCGRHCYSEKDWENLEKEEYNPSFVEGLIKNGHHSVFEHINLTFSMKGIPKILAMVLNNEKQYATSEKSARYTQMQPINMQKRMYDKWLGIFEGLIEERYSQQDFPMLYMPDNRGHTQAIRLAQENARYMTSVFTPTKMVHTFNLRQLNYLAGYLKEFVEKKGEKNLFNKRLSFYLQEFLREISEFRVEGLTNQTDRHLSFFGEPATSYFGDVYAVNYFMSLACLGQAHRHRTLDYQITQDIELGAEEFGFHIPEIIRKTKLRNEWLKDLKEISKDDFPQAQIVPVSERGTIEDFKSKLLLRLCGQAQQEIMARTLSVANTYATGYPKFCKEWLKPKCQQGFSCSKGCAFGSRIALERCV